MNSKDLERLYVVAKCHPEEGVRLGAGMKILFEASGNLTVDVTYSDLFKLAVDSQLHSEVRKRAGLELVETIMQSPSAKFAGLNTVVKNQEMPTEARVRAGIELIENCRGVGSITQLVDHASDESLPYKVRETSGIKAVGILAHSEKHLELIQLSGNGKILPEVRRVAGSRAVELLLSKGDSSTLTRLSQDYKHLPGEVIEAAKKGLMTLAGRFVYDGVLSPGSVPKPKGGAPQEVQRPKGIPVST